MLNDKIKEASLKENISKQFIEILGGKGDLITLEMLAEACKKQNAEFGLPDPTSEQIEETFNFYDQDQDGYLNFNEYEHMVLATLKGIAKVSKS